MARALANQSTFSFNGQPFFATSVSVEAATPEVVDMTPHNAAANVIVNVPTGAYLSPGAVEVEAFGMIDPGTLVGVTGNAVFTTPLGSVTRRCICTAANVTGQVGDLLRISFSLTPTDYSGS